MTPTNQGLRLTGCHGPRDNRFLYECTCNYLLANYKLYRDYKKDVFSCCPYSDSLIARLIFCSAVLALVIITGWLLSAQSALKNIAF